MNDAHNKHEAVKDERVHIFDNPKNVQRLIRGFFVCCVLLLIADLLFHRHLSFAEGVMPLEGWFGFYAFYGFVACVLLVLAATQMRKVLMRSEDYYDG
jgi:hypothetical protein